MRSNSTNALENRTSFSRIDVRINSFTSFVPTHFFLVWFGFIFVFMFKIPLCINLKSRSINRFRVLWFGLLSLVYFLRLSSERARTHAHAKRIWNRKKKKSCWNIGSRLTNIGQSINGIIVKLIQCFCACRRHMHKELNYHLAFCKSICNNLI